MLRSKMSTYRQICAPPPKPIGAEGRGPDRWTRLHRGQKALVFPFHSNEEGTARYQSENDAHLIKAVTHRQHALSDNPIQSASLPLKAAEMGYRKSLFRTGDGLARKAAIKRSRAASRSVGSWRKLIKLHLLREMKLSRTCLSAQAFALRC